MAKSAQEQEININLMPGREEPKGTVGRAINWALTVGRVLVIATEIVAIAIFALSIKLAADKQDLKEDVRSLSALVQSKETFENEFRTVQSRIENVKANESKHVFTSKAVDEFLLLLPEGLTLNSLDLADGELVFSGEFESPRELQTLISSFSTSTKIIALNLVSLEHPNDNNPNFTFTASALVLTSEFQED